MLQTLPSCTYKQYNITQFTAASIWRLILSADIINVHWHKLRHYISRIQYIHLDSHLTLRYHVCNRRNIIDSIRNKFTNHHKLHTVNIHNSFLIHYSTSRLDFIPLYSYSFSLYLISSHLFTSFTQFQPTLLASSSAIILTEYTVKFNDKPRRTVFNHTQHVYITHSCWIHHTITLHIKISALKPPQSIHRWKSPLWIKISNHSIYTSIRTDIMHQYKIATCNTSTTNSITTKSSQWVNYSPHTISWILSNSEPIEHLQALNMNWIHRPRYKTWPISQPETILHSCRQSWNDDPSYVWRILKTINL